MLLKYILLIFFVGVTPVFSQMPNLKNNALNAPTNPEEAKKLSDYAKIQEKEKINEGQFILGYGDVKFEKTLGGGDLCYITIKARNSTIYRLVLMEMKFIWPNWENPITLTNFSPRQENQIEYRISGDSCILLQEKPKVSLSECKLGEKSLSECGRMIKVVPMNEF